MKNFILQTPIFYANSSPHIGSAYTMIACDVMARFKRMVVIILNFNRHDEHGQKIYKAAMDANEDVKTFVDKMQNFIDLTEKMNISNDDFIEQQKISIRSTQKFWKLSEKYIRRYIFWLVLYGR